MRKSEHKKKEKEVKVIEIKQDHKYQRLLNTLPYKFKFNEDKNKYITDNINGKYPEINVHDKTNNMKVSNRMEKNYHLSNKKALYWNLKHYC